MSAPEPVVTAPRGPHRFEPGPLEKYLVEHVPGFEGPVEVEQYEGGQSNPTYRLTTPGARYVLRKKPPGKLLPSAHQVDREHRVMHALRSTGVPVPRMRVLCQDPDVIGTDFYVMDYLEGRVYPDVRVPGETPERRRAIWFDVIDTLAELHSVDPEAVGLGDFGRPGNYYERQVNRWIKQYRGAETQTIPEMERLIEWMPANVPEPGPQTIAHGDYRLGNLMLHTTEPRVIGVLDWELCTIGQPHADLAYLCMPYRMPDPGLGGLHDPAKRPEGQPSEEELVARYCEKTGRDGIENWEFYHAFAFFRLASISQGVYKRGLDGIASSSDAAKRGNRTHVLAQLALETIELME